MPPPNEPEKSTDAPQPGHCSALHNQHHGAGRQSTRSMVVFDCCMQLARRAHARMPPERAAAPREACRLVPRGVGRLIAPWSLHHAAGSADRHAWNGSVCGARAGCAAVSGTGAAATYLDPELALEDLLGVPLAEPGFPPFAAAERRRGDVRWLIWQLKPAATAALKVLNRWRMTLGRCVGAVGSSGGPTASAARPSACVGPSELLPQPQGCSGGAKRPPF